MHTALDQPSHIDMVPTRLVPLFLNFIFFVKAVPETGPPGPIKLIESKECDSPVNKINLGVTLNRNPDTMTMSFALPEDYGDDVTVNVEAKRLSEKGWESVYNVQDKPFFGFLNSLMGKLWTRFRKEIVPKIDAPDFVPAGSYKIDNFHATYMDVTSPQVPYGRFLATVILTVNGEDINCRMYEAELSPPTVPSMG